MKTKIIKLGDGCNLTVTLIDRQGMLIKLATLKSLVISLVSDRAQIVSFTANNDNTITMPLTYASNLTKIGMYQIRIEGELSDGQLINYTEQIIEVKDLPESTETTFITSLVLRDVHNIAEEPSDVNYNELGYEVFSPFKAYTIDQVVVFGGGLYKFTADKSAGIWDASKVEATTVAESGGMGDAEEYGQMKRIVLGGDMAEQDSGVTVEEVSSGHPARSDGVWVDTPSGYYRRYTVDLTGKYLQGFRKVRFFGLNYTKNSKIVQGIVATQVNQDKSVVVESFIPNSEGYVDGWVELPITANSVLLVATILTRNGVANVGSKYDNPSFVPTYVELYGESGGIQDTIADLEDRVENLENGDKAVFPDTFVPTKMYGVIGEPMQEFVRGIVCAINPYKDYSFFQCEQGKVFRRYFKLTPELNGGNLPQLTMKHRLIDDLFQKSTEKRSSIVVCEKPASPSSNINVLCVGASTTASGQWPSELKRRLLGTLGSGTPEADGLTNITFCGRKELAQSGDTRPVDIKVEATGGWRWSNFITPRNAIRFNVSGVNAVSIGTKYTFSDSESNTVTVIVAEVNITEGDGEILFTYDDHSGATPPAQSGTLTRVGTYGGDASISFTAYTTETYAPFYDTVNNKVSFVPYVETYCGGVGSVVDVVCVFLGNVNSGIGNDEDLSTTKANMKTFIDTLHSEYPNCKVLISTSGLGSPDYGFEDDYGASTDRYFSWNLRRGATRYSQMVNDFIHTEDDDNENPYSGFCYIVNLITEVDSEYVFPIAEKAVNTRMPDVTEITGTNGAHPKLEGYKMVADSFYRTFANMLNDLSNANE